MSLKEKVDFSEAKRVLEQLQQYIKEKCLQEEQKKNEQEVQEIPLASQPTLLSDHLGEESFLQPLEGQVLSADNNFMMKTDQPKDKSLITPANEQQDVIMKFNQSMGELEKGQVLSADNNNFMMKTDQPKDESLITPANEPQDVMMKFNQSMEELEKSQIENNAYTNVGLQGVSSDIGNNYVINNFTQGTENATTGNLAPDNNVSITQTEVSIDQFQQEKLEQPDFIQTQQSETVGIAQNEATKSMNNVEIIPDIVMPSGGIEDKGAYQASANGAQAVIQDVTPVASDTSVVLPNGITEEIANGDTLVVGPDSFGPSR